MRPVHWIGSAALLALALLVYGWAGASDRVRLDQRDDAIERLRRQLKEETTARKNEVAEIEARLQLLEAKSEAADGGRRQALNPLPTDEVEQAVTELEPPLPGTLDSEEELEIIFAGQGKDPAWAHESEQRIRARIDEGLPEASVRSVDCRSSLCRLEIFHASADAYDRFKSFAFSDPEKGLWLGEVWTLEPRHTGNELMVTSFLAREGVSLPVIH